MVYQVSCAELFISFFATFLGKETNMLIFKTVLNQTSQHIEILILKNHWLSMKDFSSLTSTEFVFVFF